MSTDIELPPVGQPQGVIVVGTPTGPQAMSAFTGTYVQDYARAAVLADRERREPSDVIIEVAEALQVRRILEEIKKVMALHPADDMPTQFQSAWALCCEEIFFRATGEQWHMDEDTPQARAANRIAQKFTQPADKERTS